MTNGVYNLDTVPSSGVQFTIGTVDLAAGNYLLNGAASNNFRCYISVNGTNYVSNSSADTAFSVETAGTFSVYCVITTSATANAKLSPMIRLATVSDATFAPYSNVCPVSGWTGAEIYRTGVNVWDEEWEVGNINTSNGQNMAQNSKIRSKNYIPVLGNTQYYAVCGSTGGLNLYEYKSDHTFIRYYEKRSNGIITTSEECAYIRFSVFGTTTTTYYGDISINYPATDTVYHAYDGDTYAIDWTDEAGTVYGGTLNVTTGVLTVTDVRQDLGQLTWGVVTGGNNTAFRAALPGMATYVVGDYPDIITTQYPVGGYARGQSNLVAVLPDCSFGVHDSNSAYFYIRDDSYNGDAAAFRTGMDGVYAVYKIATPQTYQLTPTQVETLLGVNNIWADTGDVSVEYRADTGLYIAKVISSLS